MLHLPCHVIENYIVPRLNDIDFVNFKTGSKELSWYFHLENERRHHYSRYCLNGRRYRDMLQLSNEYNQLAFKHEHFAPSGSMSWYRTDTGLLQTNDSFVVPSPFLKASEITRRWFDLLKVGDVLAPDVVVTEKSVYGSNQIIANNKHICMAYPSQWILIPPRTDL
jgi:hypothetical protein